MPTSIRSARSITDLPEVPFSDDDIWSGELPARFACMAAEHGPILKHMARGGPYAGEAFVYMVGPEANRFVFSTHRDHFSHDLGWTPIIGESLGQGLLNMDDPAHALHRKMWNPAFTATAVAGYLTTMQEIIARRTGSWAGRGEIDLYDEAREITFDVAAGALAGLHTGAEVDRMRHLFYILIRGFGEEDETWEQYVQRMLQARAELDVLLRSAIEARRGAPPEERPRDVLSMIVHARDEQGMALMDEQVLAHLNILLVAGHETTTTLSAWVLYLLATHPEYRARIEAELDALLAESGGAVTIEVLRGARTLDLFVREAARLYAPVFNVPRGVVKEFEFAGYTVPAGTQLRLAIAAGHRLPHVFADPDTFDPERFAAPREEDRRTPYALATFGGGPRICIGINVAQIEVKVLAVHVLRMYRLEPAGPPPVHAGHWTAFLPGGMPMRVSARA